MPPSFLGEPPFGPGEVSDPPTAGYARLFPSAGGEQSCALSAFSAADVPVLGASSISHIHRGAGFLPLPVGAGASEPAGPSPSALRRFSDGEPGVGLVLSSGWPLWSGFPASFDDRAACSPGASRFWGAGAGWGLGFRGSWPLDPDRLFGLREIGASDHPQVGAQASSRAPS
jgi:hypothetical protein